MLEQVLEGFQSVAGIFDRIRGSVLSGRKSQLVAGVSQAAYYLLEIDQWSAAGEGAYSIFH
jgi:hypothetical protein